MLRSAAKILQSDVINEDLELTPHAFVFTTSEYIELKAKTQTKMYTGTLMIAYDCVIGEDIT